MATPRKPITWLTTAVVVGLAWPSAAQSPGPLVLLLSTVAVLQERCGLKPNIANMQKIVRENGFQIDEFLPTGTFAGPMREQISTGYTFLKQKGRKQGCAIFRESIRRNFPEILTR